MKYFIILGHILLICLLFFESALSENLTISINANEFHINKLKNGLSEIEMRNFGATTTPGKPHLPAKTFMIALPPGAQVQHVSVMGDGPVEIDGRFKIRPVKLTIPGRVVEDGISDADILSAQHDWQNNFAKTYSRNFAFPEQIGDYLGQGQWRKYTYARVRFYPMQFNPKTGRLLHYPSATVSIDYSLPIEGSSEWKNSQAMLCDKVLDDIISTQLINFDEAQAWYQPNSTKQNSSQQYDFLIIVRDHTTRQALAPFRQWKEKIGHRVKIVTTDSIYAHVSGGDEAEQIRNFLINVYSSEHWGVRYVLLIGDVNELPIRYLFPSDTEWPYLSDYYYAKLSTSINKDGDNHFGEFGDDNLDATADVLVGRIPFSETYAISDICNNIMSFEKDNGSWKYHMLMASGVMDYDAGSKTDCAVWSEYMTTNILNSRGWRTTTLYEKHGLDTSTYQCDHDLDNTNYIAQLGNKRQGVIHVMSHGSPTGFSSTIWSRDLNNNNRCDYSKDPAINESSGNWFSAIDDIPARLESVTFLCGCSTGPLCRAENFNIASSWQISRTPQRNLGKTYIINGAPAVIASTAGADYKHLWTHPNNGNWQSLSYYFYDHLINKDEPVGDAFYASMLEYVNKHKFQRGIRVFNYYGDPTVRLKGFDLNPGGRDVVIHDKNNWGFAADNDANGDMYTAVIASDNNTAGDVKIYKSTDHGQTWTVWNSISIRGAIFDVEVIVGKYGSDEFVDNRLLVFYTTSGGTIHVSRFPLAGGSPDDVIIISEGGSNAPHEIAAARDPVSRFYKLYIAYELWDTSTGKQKVKTARSANNGVTWTDWDSFPDYHSPSIDAGPNSQVYIACQYQNIPYDVHVFQSTDGGENWGSSKNVTSRFDADGYGNPVVAASTDPARPTVWVAFPTWDEPRWDIRYVYTKDAGTNWSDENTLASNTGLSCALHMKGFHAYPNQWMNVAFTNTNTKPQVYWRYSSGSTPDSWSAPRIVNDFEAAGFQSLPPKVVYSPGSAGSGSGVIYAGNDTLFFTAPWLTNQMVSAQNNSPTDENLSIQIDLQKRDDVLVTIHNALGHLVRTLPVGEMSAGHNVLQWDGRSNDSRQLPPGAYLATVKTSQSETSQRLFIQSNKEKTSLKKTTGSGWTETSDLEHAFTVSSLAVVDGTKLFAATATNVDAMMNEGAVFRSVNNGEQWDRMGGMEACWSLSTICQTADGALLAGGLMLIEDRAHGVIYRSENEGHDWPPVLIFPDGFVTDIFRAEDNSLYAATGWNGIIWKSENDGVEWHPIAELREQVNAYCIMQASNGLLFIGMENANQTGQILWSEDGGGNWQPAEGLDDILAVYDIIEAGEKLYAGVRGSDMGWVYQSETGGHSWTKTSELVNTDIRAVHSLLEVSEAHEQPYILAGTEMMQGPSFTTVYKKELQQPDWEKFNTDLDMANTVYALAKSHDHVFAGTGYIYGNVYHYNYLVTSQRDRLERTLPATYELAQNYPNPFNPETTIRFELPKSTHVILSVFNVQGHLIRTLVNDTMQPGYHHVSWDGKADTGENVTSGLYVYAIVAGNFKFSKKMIVLK